MLINTNHVVVPLDKALYGAYLCLEAQTNNKFNERQNIKSNTNLGICKTPQWVRTTSKNLAIQLAAFPGE